MLNNIVDNLQNNVGSKTLFNAVFIRPKQVVHFWLCSLQSSVSVPRCNRAKIPNLTFLDIAPYTAPWNTTTVLTDPLSISLLWETFPDSLWYDYPRGYHITFQRVGLGGIRTSGDDVAIVRVGYKTKNYTWRNLPYYTKYKIEMSTLTYRGYGPKVVLYQGNACIAAKRSVLCSVHIISSA